MLDVMQRLTKYYAIVVNEKLGMMSEEAAVACSQVTVPLICVKEMTRTAGVVEYTSGWDP
jgi:hypothetical protein